VPPLWGNAPNPPPAGSTWSALLTDARDQMAELRQRAEVAEAERDALLRPALRSWWRRLFGGE
jgi:hypothetical protein